MPSPQGYILYRIYYGDTIVYLGRTKQPLQARIRGHMFQKPMHKLILIQNVSKIEYTELRSEADMNLYEIYFINLWKPALNRDDKARDKLSIRLSELEWIEFVPTHWEDWKKELADNREMPVWNNLRNEKLEEELFW